MISWKSEGFLFCFWWLAVPSKNIVLWIYSCFSCGSNFMGTCSQKFLVGSLFPKITYCATYMYMYCCISFGFLALAQRVVPSGTQFSCGLSCTLEWECDKDLWLHCASVLWTACDCGSNRAPWFTAGCKEIKRHEMLRLPLEEEKGKSQPTTSMTLFLDLLCSGKHGKACLFLWSYCVHRSLASSPLSADQGSPG